MDKTETGHDDLALEFPSDTEMLITRTFRAPRQLVWNAMTKPEHVRNWYGPRNTRLTSCEIDFRVGGRWRYVMRTPDGASVAFSGEFLVIQPPERIVQTWRFEPYADAESVETVTLQARGDSTLMTTHVRHKTKEHRDGHLNAGMEPGMRETFQRLDDLLARIIR